MDAGRGRRRRLPKEIPHDAQRSSTSLAGFSFCLGPGKTQTSPHDRRTCDIRPRLGYGGPRSAELAARLGWTLTERNHVFVLEGVELGNVAASAQNSTLAPLLRSATAADPPRPPRSGVCSSARRILARGCPPAPGFRVISVGRGKVGRTSPSAPSLRQWIVLCRFRQGGLHAFGNHCPRRRT